MTQTYMCESGHDPVEWTSNDTACWLCGAEGKVCWGWRTQCSARGPDFERGAA